jgi:hypothetical protein
VNVTGEVIVGSDLCGIAVEVDGALRHWPAASVTVMVVAGFDVGALGGVLNLRSDETVIARRLRDAAKLSQFIGKSI